MTKMGDYTTQNQTKELSELSLSEVQGLALYMANNKQLIGKFDAAVYIAKSILHQRMVDRKEKLDEVTRGQELMDVM